MLVNNKHTGYGKSHGNIWYVSIWDNDAFKHSGNMKFYVYDMTMIIDVEFNHDKSCIIVGTYPHNDPEKVMVFAHEKEQAIYNLLEKSLKEYQGQTRFTIDILREPKLLSPEDFTGVVPQIHPARDEMFIYECGEGSTSFPDVFFMQEHQRKGAYSETFPVMALMSDVVMHSDENPSKEGLEFTYRLLNSYMRKEWSSGIPSINKLSFPDNGKTEIPSYLQTNAIEELAGKVGAEKVIVKNGTITYDEKEEEGLPKKPDNIVKQAVKDIFGLPDNAGIEKMLLREYEDKNCINLSEIYQYGLSKTLTLFGFSDKIIDVNPNVAGVCRKICIYEGQFHVIPMDRTEESLVSLFDFLGNSEEVVHICNDTDYPKNLLPAPKLIQ